jgi:hypothetical protein
MRKTRVFAFVLLAMTAPLAGALWLQHEAGRALRQEIDVLKIEDSRITQLRLENQRLMAQGVSPADLAGLRRDHLAVEQLRAEVEALRGNVEKRERAPAARLREETKTAEVP